MEFLSPLLRQARRDSHLPLALARRRSRSRSVIPPKGEHGSPVSTQLPADTEVSPVDGNEDGQYAPNMPLHNMVDEHR